MITIQYKDAYTIMSKVFANNPQDPFGSNNSISAYTATASSPAVKGGFTFPEVCTMIVGAAGVCLALYAVNRIYVSTRSLTPTLNELLAEMYDDQKSYVRGLFAPKYDSSKNVA